MENKFEIPTLECKRCGHEWVPRVKVIRTCPKCRSPYWDTPAQSTKKEKENDLQ